MRFFTTAKLGPNRELTPEGFVLFKNVSVARTGEQIYGPGETEIAPGDDGLVHVLRSPEEVFRPETLASLNGKPFVIQHPEEDVTPDSWQMLTNGVWLYPRRGEGEQKDEMVADLLVTTKKGIAEIDLGTREISLGYDADYFQTAPGRGEQRNIIINHGALVDEGRCGSRCSLKDHAHKGEKGSCMKKSIKDRILDAFKTKDEEGLKKALEETKDEPEGSEHHVHVHLGEASKAADTEPEDPTEKRFKTIEDGMKGICDRLDKMGTKDEESEEEKKKKEAESKKSEDAELEGELGEEAPEGEAEDAKKARDSAYLVDSFEQTKMLAEIIAPGIKIPTFDRAADPKKTFKDCICALRRAALKKGTQDADTAELIDGVRGRAVDSAEIVKMPCGQVRSLFNAVGALKKAANNAQIFRDGVTVKKTDDKKVSDMERFKKSSKARWSAAQK